jgi:hypothetical protein
MTVDRGWVARLGAQLEAMPAKQVAANGEGEAWRWYDINAFAVAPPPLEQSARARMVRAINRIALHHGWGRAVEHFLDQKQAGQLADLTDPQLEDLHGRMQGYVDAAQMGCDLPWD